MDDLNLDTILCDTKAAEFMVINLMIKVKIVLLQNQVVSFTCYNLSSDVKMERRICSAHMSSLLIPLCGETIQPKGIIGT